MTVAESFRLKLRLRCDPQTSLCFYLSNTVARSSNQTQVCPLNSTLAVKQLNTVILSHSKIEVILSQRILSPANHGDIWPLRHLTTCLTVVTNDGQWSGHQISVESGLDSVHWTLYFSGQTNLDCFWKQLSTG